MNLAAIANTLIEWTPFLATGFLRNLLISVLAMLIGTLLGLGLGWFRVARIPGTRTAAGGVTSLFRNVPSFVLMFYVAFMVPVEITLLGTVMQIPTWIKATIALVIPVAAFSSDQFRGYVRQKGEGLTTAAQMFWSAWAQYFLIVLMASSTASVIGTDEIVARANRVVATDYSPSLLIATYSYVAIWFLIAGLFIQRYGPRIAQRLTARG